MLICCTLVSDFPVPFHKQTSTQIAASANSASVRRLAPRNSPHSPPTSAETGSTQIKPISSEHTKQLLFKPIVTENIQFSLAWTRKHKSTSKEAENTNQPQLNQEKQINIRRKKKHESISEEKESTLHPQTKHKTQNKFRNKLNKHKSTAEETTKTQFNLSWIRKSESTSGDTESITQLKLKQKTHTLTRNRQHTYQSQMN